MNTKISIEMAQDIHSNISLIRKLSRNPITEDEIDRWQRLMALGDEFTMPQYVRGAKIQTDDFSEQELAEINRVYTRYPIGMVIRTPDFADGEVEGYMECYNKLKAMNLDEIRKKVHFFGGEE